MFHQNHLFITGQDPDNNSSFPDVRNRFGDPLLQLVLDARGPQQLQLVLHSVVRLPQETVATLQRILGKIKWIFLRKEMKFFIDFYF